MSFRSFQRVSYVLPQHLFTHILSFMDGFVEESLRLVTGLNHGEKSHLALSLHTMLRQPVVWKDLCTRLARLRNSGFYKNLSMDSSQDCKQCDSTHNAIIGLFYSLDAKWYPGIDKRSIGNIQSNLTNHWWNYEDSGVRLCSCSPNSRDSSAVCRHLMDQLLAQYRSQQRNIRRGRNLLFWMFGGSPIIWNENRDGFWNGYTCNWILLWLTILLLSRRHGYSSDFRLTTVAFYLATLGSIVSQTHGCFLLIVKCKDQDMIVAVDCLKRTAIVADGSIPGIFDFSIASSDCKAEEMLTAHLVGSSDTCPTKIHGVVIYMDTSPSRLPPDVLLMWSVCCSPTPILLLSLGIYCVVAVCSFIAWSFGVLFYILHWLVVGSASGWLMLLQQCWQCWLSSLNVAVTSFIGWCISSCCSRFCDNSCCCSVALQLAVSVFFYYAAVAGYWIIGWFTACCSNSLFFIGSLVRFEHASRVLLAVQGPEI
jgi:hypothetical protein